MVLCIQILDLDTVQQWCWTRPTSRGRGRGQGQGQGFEVKAEAEANFLRSRPTAKVEAKDTVMNEKYQVMIAII